MGERFELVELCVECVVLVVAVASDLVVVLVWCQLLLLRLICLLFLC